MTGLPKESEDYKPGAVWVQGTLTRGAKNIAQGCRSLSRPPRAADAAEMNAPMSMESAMKMEAEAAALRAWSAASRAW